ncbi:DUF2637 domain-containing protein [Acrocarpospora macrocephala]|uniref:SpdA2 protein n=1 Tax=Acrocarpospora macrocephala TaxID=150177 RepID=A0A5M3WFR8_9ACTN|nr:DUF2637 domain-containing protein [Acrocarpospora macrocephala]GES07945.1 SpdA2 protein [Acrocarpospora macrocephala]
MRRQRLRPLDSGPVLVLALIAAVGSFTHISSLAADHGQDGWQAWAVAVCIDLMCVMAARELQRDKRTGRPRRGLVSWPGLVLAGGIVLTLAANLAQAEPSPWGWITAATPAVAFLVAVSMLERRAGHGHAPVRTPEEPAAEPAPAEPANHPTPRSDDPLIAFARHVANEHAATHGKPITREALSKRLRVTPDLAADLLTQLQA